jgi:hypothetical protein
MNARDNGRSPNDRRLDQFFESVGELDKEELLEEFEQVFGEIVPPAGVADASAMTDRGRSRTAVHNEFAAPQRGRRRALRKSRPPGLPPSAARRKGSV